MMKNLLTPPNAPSAEPVKVVTDASEVTCVYYGDVHLFEECLANLVFVYYVGNKKNNKPHNKNYNAS